jgi:hypothetical protein
MKMRSLILVVLASGVLAIGGVAYATDGNDQGSGDRAWAQVDPNAGSPVLVKTKNFVSVSSPSTGVYCLHAAAGTNLANSAPVATQELNLSSTLGLVTVRRSGIPNPNCAVSELQVTTWDASSPSSFTTVNTLGFDVVVP